MPVQSVVKIETNVMESTVLQPRVCKFCAHTPPSDFSLLLTTMLIIDCEERLIIRALNSNAIHCSAKI